MRRGSVSHRAASRRVAPGGAEASTTVLNAPRVTPSARRAPVHRSTSIAKLLALAAILVGAWLTLRATPAGGYLSRDGIERMVEVFERARSTVWAPTVYVVAYAAATALALPGSLLTIVGGAVFGLGWGVVLVTLGANLGANAAFGLARVLGRDGVERLMRGRLRGLGAATARHGFMGLLALRLIPLVPFNALNVGSGLTAMPWRDYALATAIGIVPGTFVYVFFADALVQGSAEASADARVRLWIAGGLFVMLLVGTLAAKRWWGGKGREGQEGQAGKPDSGGSRGA